MYKKEEKSKKKRKNLFYIWGKWKGRMKRRKKCREDEEKVVWTAKKRENIMWIWI